MHADLAASSECVMRAYSPAAVEMAMSEIAKIPARVQSKIEEGLMLAFTEGFDHGPNSLPAWVPDRLHGMVKEWKETMSEDQRSDFKDWAHAISEDKNFGQDDIFWRSDVDARRQKADFMKWETANEEPTWRNLGRAGDWWTGGVSGVTGDFVDELRKIPGQVEVFARKLAKQKQFGQKKSTGARVAVGQRMPAIPE